MNEKMLDSVISTRIRLARNIKSIPFPGKESASQANEVAKRVYSSLGSGYKLYVIKRLDENEAGALVEKHLISKELLTSCPYGSVAVSDDECVSIMLNEEDHVREQVILNGFRPDEAFKIADALDDRICEKAQFAFSPQLGYLTACPTNLGTGMRASVMMFLPALTMAGMLDTSAGALNLMNVAVRGVYGEGSASAGFVYQISNQRTLGVSEQEILELVRDAAEHLADTEAKAREILLARRGVRIRDEIMRAYGVASNAYSLPNKEMISCLALVKLGAYYGMIKLKKAAALDALIAQLQPCNLISSSDVRLDGAEERDVYRAALVRKAMRELTKSNID